jgi:hypothetical protein
MGNGMTRAERLAYLKDRLREQQIWELKDKLEGFLGEANDDLTTELQNAIDEKLEGAGFHHCYFSDFLNEYRNNHPADPSGYSVLSYKINEEA